jgi:hypothetical protein
MGDSRKQLEEILRSAILSNPATSWVLPNQLHLLSKIVVKTIIAQKPIVLKLFSEIDSPKVTSPPIKVVKPAEKVKTFKKFIVPKKQEVIVKEEKKVKKLKRGGSTDKIYSRSKIKEV